MTCPTACSDEDKLACGYCGGRYQHQSWCAHFREAEKKAMSKVNTEHEGPADRGSPFRPTHDEKGRYRLARYDDGGNVVGWRLCPPGDPDYVKPDARVIPTTAPRRVEAAGLGPVLTSNAAARKHTPIYSGFIKYFPRAMAAVAVVSQIGNEQHNPGQPLHWDRSKSGDELDCLARHLADAGTFDTDGVRHSAKVAWRAMANLEKELERAETSGQGFEPGVRSDP